MNTTEELLSLSEFREFMFQPLIPISVITNYEDRPMLELFPFWRRHKILPFIPVGTHQEDDFEISIVQLIWIRILDSLRHFNYPFKFIKGLHEYFFKDSFSDDLPKQILLFNKEQFEKKKLTDELNDNEVYILQLVDSLLVSEQARLFMYKDRNYLSELIINCISTCQDAGILLYLDGSILEHVGEITFNHRLKNGVEFDKSAPHIYLPIKYYLQEFLRNEQLEKIVMPNLLNLDEKNVLEELRNENISELIIKKTGNDIFRVESSKEGTIAGDKAKEIRKILGLKNYEEIQLSTRDEKTLTFKKKAKRLKIK